MWETKYHHFGVVRIEGHKVKVYYDMTNYTTVYGGQPVTHAAWAGGELNITLANGNLRRYRDRTNYTTLG